MVRGKLCLFERKDIEKIEPDFDCHDFDEIELYNILEEHIQDLGFVVYDEDIVFEKEIINNRYHERRYNCMVLKGTRRKGKFILKQIGIQYKYIK